MLTVCIVGHFGLFMEYDVLACEKCECRRDRQRCDSPLIRRYPRKQYQVQDADVGYISDRLHGKKS